MRCALAALALCIAPWIAWAAPAVPRVVSINLCTDQLVLALADPEQILGLSPFARDAAMSRLAERARAFPVLAGAAEEVLALRPDLVLAGTFTKRATRDLIKRKGLRVVEVSPARSIAEARAQIAQVGSALGQGDRAAALVREIDEAAGRVRDTLRARPLSVLPLFRRGWASGRETLVGSLIDTVGLRLAGGPAIRAHGGLVTLEEIVALRPDRLLVTSLGEEPMDQGAAFLRHPSLAALYPPHMRLVLPETLTTCGGPGIAEALERLRQDVAARP